MNGRGLTIVVLALLQLDVANADLAVDLHKQALATEG